MASTGLIGALFALTVISGVCQGYPHEHEEEQLLPESPVFPGHSLTTDTVPPEEVPEKDLVPPDAPKTEEDLKTDATFWWPFSFRSFYPYYRSYYRYYTPRVYRRYYYW